MVYIKVIIIYLIVLVVRWREVIVAGEKDDIFLKLCLFVLGLLSLVIIFLCLVEWIKIFMLLIIKEMFICVVKLTFMGETRNSVVVVRGLDAIELRLSV